MNEKIALAAWSERKCKTVLAQCPQLENSERLRDVFHVDGLYTYRAHIRPGADRAALVEQIFSLFWAEEFHGHDSGMLLFLRLLFPINPPCPKDELAYEHYQELERLYIDLDAHFSQHHPEHYPSLARLNITPGIVADLANCLLKCPSMRDEEKRERIWQGFPPSEALPASVPVAAALSMIRSCPSFEEVERLIQRVGDYDGNTPGWKDLHHTWRTIKRSFTYIHLRELQALIEWIGCPEHVWREICVHNAPHPAEIFREVSLFTVLEKLAWSSFPGDTLQPTHLHPILKAAVQIAQHMQSTANTSIAALNKWIEDRARESRIPDVWRNAQLQPISKHTPGANCYHFLVALHPDGEDKYSVQTCLLDDSEYQLVGDLESYDPEPKSLREIRNVINEQLKQCLIYFGKLNEREEKDLIIELLVPNKLLSHNFDQWYYSQPQYESVKWRIGIKYTVVVRSWKRASTRSEVLKTWRDMWNKIKQMKELDEESPLGPDDVWLCDRPEMMNIANFFETLATSQNVCLVMNYMPPSKKFTIFDAIIVAGIPVALWPRKALQDIRMREESFFPSTTGKLLKLPEKIKDYRRLNRNNEEHLGCHLTLLWDDPEKCPRPPMQDDAMDCRAP